MNSKKVTALGLALVLGMSAAACGSTKEEAEEPESVAVEVQTPRVGSLTLDSAYIGTVMPQEQVYVIPKTSGTVTETFFEVGDQVQAGDVLFKIDDEAAQLQMANARAAYETAQAGVTAQNGGARDLQNYQTEEQIRQLRESLYDTDDQIDEMQDSLGDMRDDGGKASEDVRIAQEKVTNLTKQIGALEEEIKQTTDPAEQKRLGETIYSKNLELAIAQGELSMAQATLNSIEAGKTQLKSGIDQIENSQDTIRDNLAMAEQAYAITQGEIYPQSDAVSAAQLQQAAVGIDSAQMQLDFCTVTAPISGIVESVSVEKNGMAAAGNPAYIISNKESMTVTFFVAEKAKNVLNVGDQITVERNESVYEGTITEIGTMANAQTKLFQVKASIAGAGVGEQALPNGVSVKVYATTQKEDSKLIIPYDSVYFSAGDAYVYCVENGQVIRKEVTTGLMSDTEVVIEEGLTEDSQVVSNWSSKLRNGIDAEVVSINGEAVVTSAPEDTETEDGGVPEGQDAAVGGEAAADEETTDAEETTDTEEAADGEEEADSKEVTEEEQ